jgi:hypothetical protein
MHPLGQKLLHALCGQKFLPFGPKTNFFGSIGTKLAASPMSASTALAMAGQRQQGE